MNQKLRVKILVKHISLLHTHRKGFFYSQVLDWRIAGAKPLAFIEFCGSAKKRRL